MSKRGNFWVLLLAALIFMPAAISTSEEVEEEVYLFVRKREILAFSAVGDRWVTQKLHSKEQVVQSKYGGHVAVVVTNSRVLGFSALTNRWIEEKLSVEETPVTLEAKGNVGTVITNQRAFGFSAKTGRWVVRRLGLEWP